VQVYKQTQYVFLIVGKEALMRTQRTRLYAAALVINLACSAGVPVADETDRGAAEAHQSLLTADQLLAFERNLALLGDPAVQRHLRTNEFETAKNAAEEEARRWGMEYPSMCAYPVPALIAYSAAQSQLPPERIAQELAEASEFWEDFRDQARSMSKEFLKLPDQEALLHMAQLDQAVRTRMDDARELIESKSVNGSLHNSVRAAHMCMVDLLGTALLKEYLARHGWPTISNTSKSIDAAAWLVLVHSIHDLGFQQRALDLAEPYLVAADIDQLGYARLRDRILNMQSKPQLYGTQYECVDGRETLAPYDDLAAVRVRRRALELPPLELDRGPC
jgi:hypothetical protein